MISGPCCGSGGLLCVFTGFSWVVGRGRDMDRYQRVEKPREETPINENEMRITAQGRIRNYISYATSLLQEKGSNEIVFKAMGRAINKTVMIVELIKRRIVGLHQNTSVGSTDITDTWEPLEEGLLLLETTRHVSMITITLSKTELDTSSIGYQSPIPPDQVKPLVDFDYEAGFANMTNDYEDAAWDNRGRGYGRGGWAYGRGRSFRGRGRGGYGGGYNQHEAGGYDDEAPFPAQGRGYGRGRGRFRGRGRDFGPNRQNQGVVKAYSNIATAFSNVLCVRREEEDTLGGLSSVAYAVGVAIVDEVIFLVPTDELVLEEDVPGLVDGDKKR
ncbi:hypothetical protein Taro_022983 [Colocasia esculenta]|uniref:DNA/RNA-binding protein Alba-like domain-containing protein n=1 Tax=Colocasia esculenta TaxID=4460 RepID=A0A843V3D6_COLES|nr:hypothetical protein [Colocasia esculenta]